MTVFTHGAGFLPWSLTFPLAHEGFPSIPGMGRVCCRKHWKQIILGSGRTCLRDTGEKEEAKAGQEARAGLCNVAAGGADYASGAFGVQGDSPPACACLDYGASHVWERGAQVSCWVNHFKALFLRQWVSILLRQ